jgi:protein pelota
MSFIVDVQKPESLLRFPSPDTFRALQYVFNLFIVNASRGRSDLKVLGRNYKKGIVKLVPENLDDLWHLWNLVYAGDVVYARTTREVKLDTEFGRPQKGKRVSLILGVHVRDVVWDKALNRLRVHGRLVDAPDSVAGAGAFHTLNVTVGEPLTIVKEKGWAGHMVERLERASKTQTKPIIIISIDDEEYCIALMRQYGIDVSVECKIKLPGKLEADQRENALHKAFQGASSALRQVWQGTDSPIVVLGLGFVKNQFANYVRDEAPDLAKVVVEVKSVNSSGVAGIHEALRSGILSAALRHLRVAEETEVVEEVLSRLGADRRDVTYGFDAAKNADLYGAVETLLVADLTIRSLDDEKRLVLENIMKGIEAKKGKIVVVSVEHEAGEKLLALGGIAALLRYPIT